MKKKGKKQIFQSHFSFFCTPKKPSIRAPFLLSFPLCVFQQFFFFFIRRKPTAFIFRWSQYTRGNIVRSRKIYRHLLLQVFERIIPQISVKSFVVVPVRAFHFPVMPRCPRPYRLMLYPEIDTKFIKLMDSTVFRLHFHKPKFLSVICLYLFRLISEISESP